jgi:GT2 family glycosyltransferase
MNTRVRVLISILNWNGSRDTVACVHSLQQTVVDPGVEFHIRVIDNASRPEEIAVLQSQLPPGVEVFYNTSNAGFTGGQNINIEHAISKGYDYVWLLNNDTQVPANALNRVVQALEANPQAGAASPLIVRLGDTQTVDFCGAIHDWQLIDTVRCPTLAQAQAFCEQHKAKLWAMGTALMLRVQAVKQVGLLNPKLFAYYEDDDYGARLIAHGWQTTMVLNAYVEHACFDGDMYRRAPYFFYLMNRNALLVALAHTPKTHRRLLRLRFVDRALVMAQKLADQGQPAKSDACLLGLVDGLRGVGGPPRLDRAVPFWLRVLRPISRFWNRNNPPRPAQA